MNIVKRPLGRSGLQLSPLVFGSNIFGWTIGMPMAFRLLDLCLDAGINMVDTADVYTNWLRGHIGGEAESIIGAWLAQGGRRERILVATKVGMDMGPAGKGLSRAHIRKSIDASLRRLRTDYVDLYQAHIDDEHTPLEETLGAFAELMKEGKVRAIGASNYPAARLREAFAIAKRENLPRYESLQPAYNLYERSYEQDYEALCLAEGVGVICYQPLARGFLSGKYRTEADLGKSRRGARLKHALNPRGMRVLDALADVALENNSTSAAVALAWLIGRPSITAPIVSATNPGQIAEMISALTLDLNAASLQKLNEASA